MAGGRSILVGRFGAPHGVRGQIRLRSFTAEPQAIAGYRTLKLASGKAVRILAVRPQGAMLVADIEGVSSREAAEALNSREIFVDRAELPEPGEEEFYHADLVGLEARSPDGVSFGTVTAVHDHGGGDILEIRQAGGRDLLIAFTRANVPAVDLAGGYLVAVPPAEIEAREDGGGDGT